MNIASARYVPVIASILAMAAAILLAACAPTSGPSTGVDSGDLAPPFAMKLVDGSEVSLKDQVERERPALMMFFATW